MSGPDLSFKIAPYAIEDLGSNLYTSFPRVLAEFVANAYDADASWAEISFDFDKVEGARRLIRRQHQEEFEEAEDPSEVTPLADRFLPDRIFVEIWDDGFGMSQDDLNERFLWTARKRRTMDPIPRSTNRPLMGRKGLGKLAGFGVARVLEVITKKADKARAIKFRLDYDQILEKDSVSDIEIESSYDTETFAKDESGTKIRLRRLGFDAVKSRQKTVRNELAEHFEFVDPDDFKIYVNEDVVPPPKRQFAFAWPEPEMSRTRVVAKTLETELGEIEFGWRIRFRKDRRSLSAQKRGVRVYAHNRLAAAPSLFDADTNMHGFRMTDYLDGVVTADFIDDQTQDYVSTDRKSLRWDTPLLSPLREFLSDQIKEACKQYQAVRDEEKTNEVLTDEFTQEALGKGNLTSRELTLCRSIAVRLARLSKQGVADEKYREVLPQVVRAVGHGEMYSKLSSLADMSRPDLNELIAEVVKLNRSELDGSTAIVRSRLKAIEALEKQVRQSPKDKGGRNEGVIQELFEEAPWLIDPLYKDFLTADKSMNTTIELLQRHLEVEVAEIADDIEGTGPREADLVFLMSDLQLEYVLIVELKATNKEAEVDDVLQLREYMDMARKWLADNGEGRTAVRGELICTPPTRQSRSRKHRRFWIEVDKLTPESPERVRAYARVLKDTNKAHAHILEIAAHLECGEDLADK